ncbi:hypothetical protein SAMN06296952_1138 [Oscillospiraceae bacterium]|nr:hypothetical protein SAMN06296952_1138 [Oscillospiraceae bacterium]
MVISIEHELISSNNIRDFEISLRGKMSLASAEIWISEDGTDFPCLGILVNSTKAVVNIFFEDGSNYVSIGDEEQDGYVTFCKGQYEVASYQLIGKEDAIQAILDFYMTKDRSEKISWEQLS